MTYIDIAVPFIGFLTGFLSGYIFHIIVALRVAPGYREWFTRSNTTVQGNLTVSGSAGGANAADK